MSRAVRQAGQALDLAADLGMQFAHRAESAEIQVFSEHEGAAQCFEFLAAIPREDAALDPGVRQHGLGRKLGKLAFGEFGDLEYVNIGRIIGSLSQRPSAAGRRDVYVAEIKQRGTPQPFVRILRMQKWGIREHLDENKDLLRAMVAKADVLVEGFRPKVDLAGKGLRLAGQFPVDSAPVAGFSRQEAAIVGVERHVRDVQTVIKTARLPVCLHRLAEHMIEIQVVHGVGIVGVHPPEQLGRGR